MAVKESSVTINNSYDHTQVETIKGNPNYIFWEPSISFWFGIPNAKLQLQATQSTAFNNKNIDFQPSVLSVGVLFSFKSSSAK